MIKKRRRNNRLLNYDYSQNGWYFATICTAGRKNYFGAIVGDKMVINEYGKIVENQWLWLRKHYKHIKLDEYVVMPNHLHGILVIERRDRSRPVPTERIKSLSGLIGAFKTTSSKLIHGRGLNDFAWQRSFYDHIIRTEKSLHEIRKYIKYNPLQWAVDRENGKNV